ncbi:MAG TPA: TIR-like protein FxsC [Thermoanaerobaculia bacterium]|nr:TIR-like protein FxsC [Thermoanaerobaculia bacterium]
MSPNFWFFLSYARLDSDEYLKKFFKELVTSVRLKVGGPAEEIGFFDTHGIELGEDWSDALSQALQTARVLVPIYTPSYFQSPACGREWQAFEERRAAYASEVLGEGLPPVILPVLWVPQDDLPSPLPGPAAEIQHNHERFGPEYPAEGLHLLMRIGKYRDLRREIIDDLADAIIAAAREHPLPPLPSPPSFQELASSFHQEGHPEATGSGACGGNGHGTPVHGADPAAAGGAGPRYVQFLFVAGRRSELQGLRKRLEGYGPEGGVDWQPYVPDHLDEVAYFAQSVAAAERLRYEVLPLGPDLVERLEAAERDNKIVALVVDTWTLRLEHYHRFLREYDKRSFCNCVVVVPWNPRDEETTKSRGLLEKALQVTFLNRFITRDPQTFHEAVHSPEELRKSLSTALNAARMRILNMAEVKKRAESDRVITKPIL